MFSQQGPGGIYYSAIQTEPDMHPLIEMGASIAPYAVGFAGLSKLASTQYTKDSQYTYLDILQKQVRNIAELTPLGIGNTFRIPEYLSPYMSARGLGLDIGKSILDPTQDVGKYILDADYLTNRSTKNVLENILGKDKYSKISAFLTEGQKDFQLVYEQSLEGKGKSNLIFQQLEEYSDTLSDGTTKEIKNRVKKGSNIQLGGDFRLMNLNYGDTNYDFLEIFGKDKKLNPAVLGFFQSLGLPGDTKYSQIYTNTSGNKAKFGLVSSTGGVLENFSDLKKRTALLTAPLSSGINRFNRLLEATKNQIPILGDFVGKLSEATGLSLKTRPDAFYKQYASLGLKAAKIGSVYLGLQTVDHYRRNFGTVGNMVASAGVGAGVGFLYDKMSAKKKFGAVKAGVAAFAAQIIMPGFDQGLVEGASTTMTNIDIGRSMIGQMTGLSYLRRGIEGVLPGFTDYTVGLALGIGVAGLSYSGHAEGMLKRTEQNKLTRVDKILKGFVPKSIKDRIGFVSGVLKYKNPDSVIKARALVDVLDPENFLLKQNKGNFVTFNPLKNLLGDASISDSLYKEYKKGFDEIVGKTPLDDLAFMQRYKLERFFLDRPELLEKASPGIDAGKVKAMGLDFTHAVRDLGRSNIHIAKYIENDLNRSLIERISYINKKYEIPTNFFSPAMRRAEILGAEMYHSFFGATLEGKVTREIAGEQVTKTYQEFAKELDAKPILKRFGLLVAGTALIHQVFTTGIFGSMDDASELKEIYSGKKMIEVKAGRFWEGGGTPYEGNETRYFRPHQHAILMSQARERAVWGDDTENFNPISKFFLKNFTYYLEEKNYYDRPYPITGEAFSDVPILSSILKPTIGRIVKPLKLMHQEELTRTNADTGLMETAYLQEFGSSPELGQNPPGVPIAPGGLTSILGEIQYQQREIEGLPGYARNYMQKLFTGRETLGTRQFEMANASEIDSLIKDFWDMDLGGMAFTSEALRRVLPRPRGDIEKYNPIANSMPEYIPDTFKRGDPYRSIPNGFARLPGEGYAALNPEVKGIDPEDYPDIHKYKILADIAPTSRKTMQLKNQLFERRAAGVSTEFENKIMDKVVRRHQKTLSKLNDLEYHPNAIKTPVLSDLVSTGYKGIERFVRKASAPVEYLIPGGFRPTQKLLGDTRSSIEIYEQERLYGTVNAFWDKHYRDWFRPAMYSAANMLGYSGKPVHVQQREETNELFDKLNFYKFMKQAQNADNIKDKNRFLRLASSTRVGVNPNGDALGLYLSLPNAERKFFNSFAQATNEDRTRILEMIPEDQEKLYKAVWSRIDEGERVDLATAQNKTLVDEQYLYKQMQETESFLEGKLPGPDWIGWHKDVDMEDVKIKHIKNIGAEIADHDVWESQTRRVARKPFLEGSDIFLLEAPVPSRSSIRRNINNIVQKNTGINFSNFNITETNRPYNNSSATIEYNDLRYEEMLALTQANLRG